MNWRQEPRIKKLLENDTIESLVKTYFQRVYEWDQIPKMEKALELSLRKYEEGMLLEKLLENDDEELEPFINELLDSHCKHMENDEVELDPLMKEFLNTFRTEANNPGEDHTPENMLTLAMLFIKVGDFPLACEVIWCSASLALQEFIVGRQLNVEIKSQSKKAIFARALSRPIGNQFCVFEGCHTSFFSNSYDARRVDDALEEARFFIHQLRVFDLTKKKKQELEQGNYETSHLRSMKWRHDHRVRKLLERDTLESLMKVYFRRVYRREKIEPLEIQLKRYLDMHDKKHMLLEKLLENDEDELEPFMKEFLDVFLCEEIMHLGENHSSETLLIVAKLFLKVGNFRLACEVVCCSASLALQEFCAVHHLNVNLWSETKKSNFAKALSREIGNLFGVLERCHLLYVSYFSEKFDAIEVKRALERVNMIIQQLHDFQLSDEKMQELEKRWPKIRMLPK